VVQCGGYHQIDLGSQRITSHPAGYDFVDYEQASGACGDICLDWVQIDVCDASCSSWVTVFNWGDGVPDSNTNVAGFGADGEDDNEPIPAGSLRCANGYCTGIEIDVDAFGPVPPGGYRYIRIWSPINWPNNDGAEVDSIEVVP
jgi:hypothetical protein